MTVKRFRRSDCYLRKGFRFRRALKNILHKAPQPTGDATTFHALISFVPSPPHGWIAKTAVSNRSTPAHSLPSNQPTFHERSVRYHTCYVVPTLCVVVYLKSCLKHTTRQLWVWVWSSLAPQLLSLPISIAPLALSTNQNPAAIPPPHQQALAGGSHDRGWLTQGVNERVRSPHRIAGIRPCLSLLRPPSDASNLKLQTFKP